jgi:acyl-coenzyme A synthetase/AMP-(fatty) acid ligase
VVGRPDPEWGSVVTALLVPTHRAEPPSLDALRAFAANRLATFKTPRRLEIVETIPRTHSGKIARTLLS